MNQILTESKETAMKEEELWAQERLALKTSLEEVRLEALRVRSPMCTKEAIVTLNCATFLSSVVSSKCQVCCFSLIETTSKQP